MAEIPQKIDDRPQMKHLNRHIKIQLTAACEQNSEVWKDLGVELLPDGERSVAQLRTISANSHGDINKCCASLFSKWLDMVPDASWRQLIETLKVINLQHLAMEIERKLIPQEKTTTATPPLSMPPLDKIKQNPSLVGNGQWPFRPAEPTAKGNEMVTVPNQSSANDITDANGLPCYQMKSNPQGIGVIINNKTFSGRLADYGPRTGTDTDAAALQKLFTHLGFYTNRYNDLTASQMRQTLKTVSDIDHTMFDCLLVAILTHGDDGKLYGTDSESIPVEDLTKLFYNNQCPSLVGKPKIFFLQACRGKKRDSGVKYDMTDGDDKEGCHLQANGRELDAENEAFETDSGGTIPITADCLLAYATVPGYVSWRNSANGSYFITALINVFTEMADSKHLLDMLTEVNRRVAVESEPSDRTGKKKQMPQPVSTLMKKLYFNPGK